MLTLLEANAYYNSLITKYREWDIQVSKSEAMTCRIIAEAYVMRMETIMRGGDNPCL